MEPLFPYLKCKTPNKKTKWERDKKSWSPNLTVNFKVLNNQIFLLPTVNKQAVNKNVILLIC